MECGCERSRVGRVFFRYGDSEGWENIVSRRLPICWECTQQYPNSQVVYNIEVEIECRAPFLGTSDGQVINPFRYQVRAIGPILDIFPIVQARSGDQVWVDAFRITAHRNTNFPPGSFFNEPITFGFGGQMFFRPVGVYASQPAARIVSLTATRESGGSDPPPQRLFRVYDSGGTLYRKSDSICPQVRIVCDEDCPPGQERICDCCCPCPPLLSEARSIQSMLRGL